MITTETQGHFKVGEKVEVYQRPIQQAGFDGVAELVEFVSDNYDYPGLQVERWKVRFEDEEPTYERIIVKKVRLLR